MKPQQKSWWRSLDERGGEKELENSLHREFPPGASELNHFDRRHFLKIMGASLALAGVPACTRQPIGKIVPYVQQPEELVPGKPLYFATAMTLGGFATGLLVESHEGHPTKIEGNPRHPSSLGATNIFHQAALLDLYNPDRAQAVSHRRQPTTWDAFVSAIHETLQDSHGKGLRILTETITSPTLHFQLRTLLEKFPEARWHQYEPLSRDNCHEGAKLAFGELVEAHFHFGKANTILALDSDFLHGHPDSLRYAREFALRRSAQSGTSAPNRLYVVESTPTVTGSNADHRLPLSSGEVRLFAHALAQRLGIFPTDGGFDLPALQEKWVTAIAEDLRQNKGSSLVVVGDAQAPEIHSLAHLINQFLENVGTTVTFAASAEASPGNQLESLRTLARELDEGRVDLLLILGGNPVFNAPADLQFAEKLSKARLRIHLSPDVNETSIACDWHIPENHFLESWSDARAFDGTTSIVQPLILPLYSGKSAHEVIDAMLAPPGRSDYDIVRDFWRSQNSQPAFDQAWRQALWNGFIENSATAQKTVRARNFDFPPPKISQALEITFRPDPTLLDGRFANNAWLQELPKPITKLTWDNAALVSPALARKEILSNGDVIELDLQNHKARLPIWITPGQPENSIGLQLGYGRRTVGRVGVGTGFDVYGLRTSAALWQREGATLKKTGDKFPLATTQSQHVIDSEERQIFRESTYSALEKEPGLIQQHSESPTEEETLYNPKEFSYTGHRWGMTIDLSACIGCAACVIACQAENNIPVVGKKEVSRGRAMHWIRVDTYFRGDPTNPEMNHQPVPCMHCENAPCELVCPVGATVHDKEGLNLQIYNRCVGTRYCSNNCPYKVRRFNFFQYADYKTPAFEPMRNPNVTVRWRGVMEKCTYCIQRISAARIDSENQNQKLRDGQIQTACQQVCPAQAIVFGDLSDSESRVSKLKARKLNFSMLGQLNTRPRTTYLAKLRNPNPNLA